MLALRPALRSARPLAHQGVYVRAGPSLVSDAVRGFASSLRLSAEELQKTPLYEFHVSHQAKMVPFAGYSMPLSYGDIGQTTAHKHVRSSAGLFDVSHMLQHTFSGASTEQFLMSLCPSSLSSLSPYSSTLSVLLNESGGIIDDTIITKHSPTSFYVVTNAGRAQEDRAFISQKLGEWNSSHAGQEVKWETLDGWGLLALQGPKAAEVLQRLTKADLAGVKFGQSTYADIDLARGETVKCHVARGGYTGEDGFEISVPPEHTVALTNALVHHSEVQLVGLGARDSLRLEAGMCLYGHDLDESVSPVEAGLSWVIGKDRRAENAAPFPGKSRILSELAAGPKRRRVGFEVTGSPAREGSKIFDEAGTTEIGVVTSGIPSPTLGTNIAMGYIVNGQHKKGTKVKIEVRKKMREAVVKPMPFVPSKYFK